MQSIHMSTQFLVCLIIGLLCLIGIIGGFIVSRKNTKDRIATEARNRHSERLAEIAE